MFVLRITLALAVSTGAAACYDTHGLVASEPEPVAPAPELPDTAPSEFLSLALGGAHSCVLHRSGRVACWGNNASGQLGLNPGALPFSTRPHWVPELDDIVEISAGDEHTCALAADGTVACWGDNHASQLGPLATGLRASYAPHAIARVDSAIEVEAGGSQSCAIGAAGEAPCWGDVPGAGRSEEPRAVAAIGSVESVALGERHSCAVREGGSVLCWGENRYGQLGREPTLNDGGPEVVVGIDDALQVTVGSNHSCALRRSGEVLCWGRNRDGQLGGRSEVGNSFEAHPGRVTELDDAIAISAGVNQSCALRATGKVRCWGVNHGDGQRLSAEVDMPQLDNVVAVDVGNRHACVIDDRDRVECWGTNAAGQLGDGTVEGRGNARSVRSITEF